MITGEIKNQVDRIWDAFWSGGVANPLEVIEQMTYLLFIKRLDELQTAKEKKAARPNRPVDRPAGQGRRHARRDPDGGSRHQGRSVRVHARQDRQRRPERPVPAAIAEASATTAEREAVLAQVNAELAALRAELAQAKSANLKVPDAHDYDEADTRRYFIDVLLREAGWELGRNASAKVPVTGMPNQQTEGVVDYVLWGADGQPLAVVEAKRSLKDPDVGQQQARPYADCLKKMKGRRPLIFNTNGSHTWLRDDTALHHAGLDGAFGDSDAEAIVATIRTVNRNAKAA